ncbi:hypothetical protein [Saccharopolyspora mangrovi]|uniref:PPE domain-containing protein n=1 Tax=Saccharopolyspora mangrovi TaxID=3082379 RepID=A0ABU6ABF1_9PSEU|nr:hypothetical protein [Saccharopolyspora sp. S2-29]MEB3368778.1 hypothetical protein [Saccharopolyspora sp. S2-29]
MGNAFTDAVGSFTSSVGDLGKGLVGGDTATREQAHAMQAAVQRAQRNDQPLNRGLDEFDRPSISQADNWKNWDQARLASQLTPSLGPEEIQSSARGWKKLGEEIKESLGDLDKRARAAAGDGMRGEAAEAGLNAAKPLQEWGTSFGQAAEGVGEAISRAGDAAASTKKSIEPPVGYDGTRGAIASVFGPAGGLVDGAMQMREQQEANQQARAVAEQIYAAGYQDVDASTPTLPPPVNPLAPPPPPPGGETPGGPGTGTGSGSGSGSGSGYSGSAVGGGSGGGHSGSSPAQSSSQWASPSPTGPGAGGGTPPGMNPGPNGPSAGFVGGMPPGAGAGAGRGAGGMGGARGAGAGMGAGGKAGGGMGAGGRAGMGGLGAGAGAGAAGAGAGGRGAAGAPGAGAGAGQRGQGGEDDEHERPSWLEEQEDIWMDDMPKTAPPVFGE